MFDVSEVRVLAAYVLAESPAVDFHFLDREGIVAREGPRIPFVSNDEH